MNGQIREFVQKHIFLTLGGAIGALVTVDLYIVYLQTHMNLYLNLLLTLLAVEGLSLSVFWGVQFRRSSSRVSNLQKNAERLNLFTEIMEECILIRDGETVIKVNDNLARMLGYEVSEIVGNRVYQFMDPGSAAKNVEWIKHDYPSEKNLIYAKRKDGTTFPLLVHGKDILYQGRKVRLSCGWNISDLMKLQDNLVETEERFRHFAESTREGLLVHEKGIIVDVNRALLEILGYETIEMIGKDSLFFVDKSSLEVVQKIRTGKLATGIYELLLRHKDGSSIPVETLAIDTIWQGRKARMVKFWNLTERKKIEEALVESQKRAQRFAEVTREGILVHDKGLIKDVNQALINMVGYSAEELIGKMSDEFLSVDSLKKIQGFRTGGYTDEPYEIKVKTKTGKYIPVEAHGSGFSIDGKEMRVVRLWDVSERKQSEEALRKSEESFRNLIEKSPDAIIIHSQEKTNYVNDAMLSLLGYSKSEELVGKIPTFFVHPEDIHMVTKRVALLQKQGDYNPPQEKRFIRKDGAVLYVEVVSFFTYFAGQPMTVAVARDLTERKKTEEALRRSEESFRNLIEKSPDGLIIHTLDTEPRTVYANEAMAKFVGYSTEEIIKNKPGFFAHSKDAPGIKHRIDRLRNNGDYNPPQEKLFIRKDGQLVHAEAVSFLIHYEGETMAAVVVRDLTERKRAEETLMKFERLSTIGEMAAGMAHEIRNPLAAISAAAQVLQRKKPKENLGQLEMILQQADRLEKLVRDTLDYAKPQALPEAASFSVRAAMESALRLSRVQFGPAHQKIEIQWEARQEDFHLKMDLGRFQQIIVNLILNAFQTLGEDGKVKIGFGRDKKDIWVRVEDNGPGIDKLNAARIFEPFFTTKETGSGLGLAISQKIAQEYGGQISVENVNPHGAAFVLKLPENGEA